MLLMKKQVKLKARETAATNKDFYNLFRPIAPGIDMMGKVAQVISALTEAITIWHISQSELAGLPKTLAIAISLIAMLLVVAILELGGRKFLQVLTRALVWKRLKNAWYISLFTIVSLVTIGIAILSFRLSTNGIHYAFVSKAEQTELLDFSALKRDYKDEVKLINSRFDGELKILNASQNSMSSNIAQQYDAELKELDWKVGMYDEKYKSGESWARSQREKYEKQMAKLNTEKSTALLGLSTSNSKKLDAWVEQKNSALAEAKTDLGKAIDKTESSIAKVQDTKYKHAAFWGTLFSFFVGFSVILAFACIISVEVFRRGSGIEVAYEESEKDPSILEMFFLGFSKRFSGFFRTRAERFAQITSPDLPSSIGFNHSRSYATGETETNY